MKNNAHNAWLHLSRRMARKGRVEEIVDFFFFCLRQDDANNLALDLFNLGYSIHGVFPPDRPGESWFISAYIKRSIAEEGWVIPLMEEMDRLAQKHGGIFDGMGTAIELPMELSEKLRSGKIDFRDL